MVSWPRIVGICGAGMMGSGIGARLVEGGLRVLTVTRSGRSENLDELGIEDVGSVDRLVAEADVILSVMGSVDAPGFAGQVADALVRSPRTGLVFAECNLLDPGVSRAIDAQLSALGVRVVDAGICGAPPRPGHAPTVFTSGAHVDTLEFLQGHGFDVWQVGEEIGAATTLKVLSAAGWQGSVALMSSVLVAAHRQGLSKWLLRDLEQHQAALFSWFAPALLDATGKARRWAPDMEVVARLLGSSGASGAYHEAAAGLYDALAQVDLEASDESYDVVVALDRVLADQASAELGSTR